MEEQEIQFNLRPLIEPFFRWRRILFALTIVIPLLVLIMNMVPLIRKDTYEADAGLAIVKSRTEVRFGSAAETTFNQDFSGSETDGKPVLTYDSTSRLHSLSQMVNNGTIGDKVREMLKDELDDEELVPGVLETKISGEILEVNGELSDMILVKVKDPDPEKATLIANTWAKEYEKLINDIYARPPETNISLEQDLKEAEEKYYSAQETLTNFMTDNRLDQVTRMLNEKSGWVTTLQEVRHKAIFTTLNLDIEEKSRLYGAYRAAQSDNRLLTFNKEQAIKRDLVDAYIGAQEGVKFNLFGKYAGERNRILDEAYADRVRNEQLLQRAKALRDQAVQGGEPRTSALALIFLKADIAGSSAPGNLDLRFENFDGLVPEDIVRDTQSLVDALEQQRADIEETIKTQEEILFSGEGLFLEDPITTTVLSDLIQETYLSLFEVGELGSLHELVTNDNPLAQRSIEVANEMMEIEDATDLLNYAELDLPINQTIKELEQEIRELQSQVERFKSQQHILTQERDLAYNTYSTLALKAAEYQLTGQLPGTEVRFASSAPVPTASIQSQKASLNLLLALFIGFALGTIGAFWTEYFGPTKPEELNVFSRWFFTPQSMPMGREERMKDES